MNTVSLPKTELGLGIGWRPELALAIDRRVDLGFVEVIAESLSLLRPVPQPIQNLRNRGVKVVPHGLGLSLGSAEPPEPARLKFLAELATRLEAPLVSEHVAIVRAGGIESGHLLPVARTYTSLKILIRNVKIAQDALPVPLAVENIATLVEWPDSEMSEAEFLQELTDQTGVQLLLDLENLYSNTLNHGTDAISFLDSIPLQQIAYVHVAGGHQNDGDGLYHDSHAEPVPDEVLDLLSETAQRVQLPGVMLERDDAFPSAAEIDAELDRISSAWSRDENVTKPFHAGN
ncbi:MAG: DUF692 family multinuclear iron-containing protein [Planctomycetaceae bacterium]